MSRTKKWLIMLALYIPASFTGTFISTVATSLPAFAECMPYDEDEENSDCYEKPEDMGWEHPADAHDAQCSSAWDQNSARMSCSGVDWFERKESQCRLHVECSTGQSVYKAQDKVMHPTTTNQRVIFSLDDVKKLSNCGGSLKVGKC